MDVVVLDSAHGHSANVIRCVKMIKEAFPEVQVIAGNVATGDATRALIELVLIVLRLVSDLVLSVPHELLPVLVFLRSQLSWTATLLQKSTVSRLSPMAVSNTPVI